MEEEGESIMNVHLRRQTVLADVRMDPRDVRVRVGAEPVYTRTLEYIDLRGAPWIVKTTNDAGKATSVAYSAKGVVASGSTLASTLETIDDLVRKRSRDAIDENAKHYPQTPFQDSGGDEWSVEFVDENGVAGGYYGLQYGTVVGPATSKTELKKMVERYLTRLQGEKSTISRDAITHYAIDVDTYKTIDVPPEARRLPTSSFVIAAVAMLVAGVVWYHWM